MALLTIEQRKEYFKDLGLEYNSATLKALQKKYMWRKEDADGKYGPDSDHMVRTVRNVFKFTKNFDPKEFRCECGGKYCCGFPTWMKKTELENLQSIRNHYGKPVEITSGMRCKRYNNSLRGSSKTSGHLHGYASDIYISGVTNKLSSRKQLIAYAKKLPNHKYSYCNGWDSNGVKRSAGNMGNAVHVESNKAKKVNSTKKASPVVAKTPAPVPTSAKATPYLTQAELNKWFDALNKVYKRAKNSTYVWIEGPNYSNIKKKCTCIAEHSVGLQVLGILPKNGYFYYHPKKKRISGNRASYVKKHTERFKIIYPHKKLTTLIKQGKLYPGDIVGFGNPGYHSMVYLGKNSKGKPIFATLGHKKGYKVTYSSYAKRKVDMIVRLKKVTK